MLYSKLMAVDISYAEKQNVMLLFISDMLISLQVMLPGTGVLWRLL